jgi:hypothetical protein
MMCMECSREYVQQLSTAYDTHEFCSARCEFTRMFPVELEIPRTAGPVVAVRDVLYRIER